MSNFNQTLAETKNCFSYNINSKQPKTYCKNKSIQRFNHRTGHSNNTDIHGLLWDERVILEVTSIDLDSKRCIVKNPNGLEWLTEISNIEFCNADGSMLRYSKR